MTCEVCGQPNPITITVSTGVLASSPCPKCGVVRINFPPELPTLAERLLDLLCTSCNHPLRQHQNVESFWPCQQHMLWRDAILEQCKCTRATIKGDDILALLGLPRPTETQ